MKKVTLPLAVGLVFLAGLGLLMYMFGTVDSGRQSTANTYRVKARFTNASGLVVNSRVNISGIPVGYIEKIELDPDDFTKALVRVRVEKRIKLLEGRPDGQGGYTNGTVIRRVQGSLLGDYFLEVIPGIEGAPIAPDGEIRNVVTESGIEAAMSKLGQASDILPAIQKVVEDLGAVTENLKGTLGGESGATRMNQISRDVATTVQNVQAITADVRVLVSGGLANRQEDIGQIIDNVERFSQNAALISEQAARSLEASLKNVEVVTREVRNIVGKSGPGVEESLGTIQGSLEKVEEALEILQETLDTVHHVARKVDRGDGTIGRLVNDDQLVTDMEETVEGASDFMSRLFRLQTHVGIRSDYLVRRNAFRTAFGVRLQPTEDKYYLFELVDESRGVTNVTRRSVITGSGPGVETTEKITETRDELRFSLQLAKRLYFMTWRIGIIESSGGLGLDLDLWSRRLTLTNEVFEMGVNEYPRLRSFLSFQFFRYFVITAGVDDPFNADLRDGFVGAALNFRDEDLKTLFTTTPSVQF